MVTFSIRRYSKLHNEWQKIIKTLIMIFVFTLYLHVNMIFPNESSSDYIDYGLFENFEFGPLFWYYSRTGFVMLKLQTEKLNVEWIKAKYFCTTLIVRTFHATLIL